MYVVGLVIFGMLSSGIGMLILFGAMCNNDWGRDWKGLPRMIRDKRFQIGTFFLLFGTFTLLGLGASMTP